jgi:hypothetical protein
VRDGKIARWHDYSNLPNLTQRAPQWWLQHISQGWRHLL